MGLVWILWGSAFLVGEAIPRGPAARVYWMIFPAGLAALIVTGRAAGAERSAALKLGWTGINWVFVWLGAVSALMGAWRLRRYLRKHPTEVEA